MSEASKPQSKDVWQFKEYQVAVGDKGLVFKTKKATAEVGWRHIVSAEHETRSRLRIPALIAGIILIIISLIYLSTIGNIAYAPTAVSTIFLVLVAGILLIIASIRRKRFVGRIKVATGDTYQISGDAAQLEEFLAVVRKKVWGK